MSQTWSILTVVTVLLAVQLCRGDTSCTISTSAGSVVQRGSSFNVSCTFNCVCKGSMSSNHPPTPQKHIKFNDTTIYYNVVDISQNRTFSCHCTCSAALDPCGLDISAGYPPDRPTNISCIYKVKSNVSGVVICTWNRGRDTFLWTTSQLWVRTGSGNHTVEPVTYTVTSNGSDSSSASLTVSSSVEVIAVWVKVRNGLGSAVSVTQNYTLSDIAMPSTPELGYPDCSSRECSICVKQSVKTQHVEIQYRAEAQAWTSHPDSSSAQVRTISSLEPYRLYYFRARSKFSSGLWSQWSSNISSWTQEEAPAKELDVWYAAPASDFKSLTVYWKEADISIARGNITGYKVSVHSQNSGFNFSADTNADARSYTVQFCADCEVTVSARNSKGMSPPARITNHHRSANPLKVAHNPAGNHNVTISWRKPGTALPHAAYVVEWYPQGHKMEELRWVRLSRADHQAVITGIQPYECYEGAVSVVYHDNSVSRSPFTGVTILESAPTAGPSVDGKDEGNKVTVTWKKIPRGQRGGCITHYTIYLESDSRDLRTYRVKASERTHVVKDLPVTVYKLWMTASTAKGEGHAGQKVYVQIVGVAEDVQLSLILVCAGVVVIGLLLVCLYQTKAVKQRVWVLFQCLMLDDVPDPANSKWAKECTQEKGKIKLQLQPSNSTITEEEEEPILVDVEELPKQSTDTHRPVSSQLPPLTILSRSTEPTSLLYPLTTYLKSFSHDSDSSDHTQTSLDTNTTVDYISSHGQENIDEEEDEEEPLEDMLDFFPTHGIVIDQLAFGGKLTLDAVKIGGSDFFSGQPFLEEEHY